LFVAWTVWGFVGLTQTMDKCWHSNPIIYKLFTHIENRDLDRSQPIQGTPMDEILASEYSYERLRVVSQDWTEPVVVRGLFANATSSSKWRDPEYLINSGFFRNNTSVVINGTVYFNRVCNPEIPEFSVEKPFDETVRRIAQGSLETIVFPPASRSKRFRNAAVEEAWNRLVDTDIDLSRIGGFFKVGSKGTALTQMFIGGASTEKDLIGTGWHCDICNNFVVQTAGTKRWIMAHPKYSKYLRPTIGGGKTAIVGGHYSLAKDNLPYFPHKVVDLQPGDMLYNPEFYWHSIENYGEGIIMGLVSRECHVFRNFNMNPLFTSLILSNHAIASIYDPEARLRLFSAIFGTSMMKPEEAVHVTVDEEARTGYQ